MEMILTMKAPKKTDTEKVTHIKRCSHNEIISLQLLDVFNHESGGLVDAGGRELAERLFAIVECERVVRQRLLAMKASFEESPSREFTCRFRDDQRVVHCSRQVLGQSD